MRRRNKGGMEKENEEEMEGFNHDNNDNRKKNKREIRKEITGR